MVKNNSRQSSGFYETKFQNQSLIYFLDAQFCGKEKLNQQNFFWRALYALHDVQDIRNPPSFGANSLIPPLYLQNAMSYPLFIQQLVWRWLQVWEGQWVWGLGVSGTSQWTSLRNVCKPSQEHIRTRIDSLCCRFHLLWSSRCTRGNVRYLDSIRSDSLRSSCISWTQDQAGPELRQWGQRPAR